MISQLRGSCTDDDNPDAWFPTIDNGDIETMNRRVLPTVKYAIGVCSRCPIRETCLEEGIKPENLAHGIWGGLLAGQRGPVVAPQPLRAARRVLLWPVGQR